jgi:hypothetical protein
MSKSLSMIDLTKPGSPTLEEVRELITSKDDSIHRQIRVSEEGHVYLSDDIGFTNLEGVLFRLPTLCAGNDYVGKRAAEDEDWIRRVRNALEKNWLSRFRGYVDAV